MRANCVLFPISPRNSPAAVAHLLAETNVQHLLVGPEPVMQKLADSAFDVLTDQGRFLPSTSAMPAFVDVIQDADDSVFEFLPKYQFRMDETYNFYHSSGMLLQQQCTSCSRLMRSIGSSSTFPKPIASWHYRHLLLAASHCTWSCLSGVSMLTLKLVWCPELSEKRVGLHTLPIFHGWGGAMVGMSVGLFTSLALL